ncbi:MAG: HAMP domain-containing sensor histidine kinase [Steroidobacteraceae bacterium]|jgi:signal transduction histidine kinase|nr:HAMP domain-containing sensor histidine kinase [Steroidobacteraceae bacterium]
MRAASGERAGAGPLRRALPAPRTTGGRLATVLTTAALVVLFLGLLAYLLAGPLVAWQSERSIDARMNSFVALHARVDPRTFGGVVATRSVVDAEQGVEYSLRAPNGVTVVGRLLEEGWAAAPGQGRIEFTQPDLVRPERGPRRMVGRVAALPDGSRLLIAHDLDRRARAALAVGAAALLGMVGAMLFAALVAWAVARRTGERLDAISLAMTRLLAGDLSHRLPTVGHAGIDRLAAEFNVALDRIERLTATMRAVADSTAHDLRTPLNRLRAAVEIALSREDDPAELRAALDTVLVEVDRVQNTLEALLRIALAESGTAPIEPVDLTAVVADVEELYKPLAEEKGLGFATQIEPGLELPGNRQLLAQAAANLIDNAIKFTPAGGRVRLTAAARPEGIVLEVRDTGPGIAPEDRERALERSRRLANAAGKPGSGLGLSLVNAVARLHGGRFELADNAPGLVARLVFGRDPERAAALARSPAPTVRAP